MLSIVIPTLNEEKELPFLLDSIKKQDFSDCEVIIADAGSEDRTLDIAREYGCKIVKGGLPAQGRNNGAGFSSGELILFLDADIVLPEGFLNKALDEFERRSLDIATFNLLPKKKKRMTSFLFNLFYNWPVFLLERVLPHAAMGILARREVFEKLNGFDETIRMAEDHEFARRGKKIAKYGVIRSAAIFVSERRFEQEGWFKTVFKYFLCGLYMLFKGPVRSDIFGLELHRYFKDRENKL